MTNLRFSRFWAVLAVILTVALSGAITAADKKESKPDKDEKGLTSSILGGLKWRNIGPALSGGRISSIAVHPTDRSIIYLGVACGNVWKSTNGGTTFQPIFDGEGSYSIGTVAIDPANPSVVWVGTGENNSQRSVAYGDGIYRSGDGGKSWKNMGLKKSEHIARIVFDPRNTNTLYVAAQGPLWGPGGDRGLFKTTDGGTTWKNLLQPGENTGVTDVVMDPKNPDVLVAATYQRRRHVWTLINGGPESGLHRTTDGGQTWTKITAGLPGVDIGRIGLAVSPVEPHVMYAIVEAAERKGGIFRSTDLGVSWEKRNPYDATAMYYGTVIADPVNIDRIYIMGFNIMVSNDGGATLKPLPSANRHVDDHFIWIEPENPKHYLVGGDGGLYESFDMGENWLFHNNFSITQFYDVAVDEAKPFYNVYGGTQDNFSWGGPARTRSASGIVHSDWFVTWEGDGFQSRIDPVDPNIVYAEAQYGDMIRYNRKTGERTGIQPKPGKDEMQLKWNWDTPILISPHKHTRLYVASDKLFRSEDRGDSWTMLNDNLIRGIDRNTLPVMGKVWGPDAVAKSASTSIYGNSTALAESPVKEGLLYVGTDDGVISVTEDGGATWRKITKFPVVPETTYVSRIVASSFDANTVFAAFDRHKMADFKPYVLKSTDAGRTWSSIAGNLPENGPVLGLAQDHINKDLMFAGTEFGFFFTVDGGKKWIELKNGLPTTAVRDVAIQKRENDLVIATFGRGFYVMDNYAPLRELTPDVLEKECTILPIKEAQVYIETQPLGGRGKSFQGDSYYYADNPPYGATITYFLKDSYKSLKEKRKEAEKEAEKAKKTLPYPTMDQLRAEDEEEAPSVIMTIADAEGNVVRKLTAANSKGLNRTTWNLRYPSAALDDDSGPMVMPGNYTATLAKRVQGVTTTIAGPVPFRVGLLDSVNMNPADQKALAEFQRKLMGLQRAVNGALTVASDMQTRIGQIRKALMETPAQTSAFADTAAAIAARLRALQKELRGDPTPRQRNENSKWSISERVSSIFEDSRMSTSAPTQTHRESYTIAGEMLTAVMGRLRLIVEGDVPALEKQMNAIGAPYTSGRALDWKLEE